MERGSVFASRRGFVIGGAIAASAAVAGVGGALLLSGSDEHYASLAGGRRPVFLSVRQFGILTAVIDTMIARAEGAPSAAQAMVASRIDRELTLANPKLGEDLRAALDFIELVPLLKMRLQKFTGLDHERRVDVLGLLQTSSSVLERSIFNGVRFLCMFFYYTDDRTWPSVGYSGPTVPEKFFGAGNRIANLG